MKNRFFYLLTLLVVLASMPGCSDIFGSKHLPITNDVFKAGKKDPNTATDVIGYAALVPFWKGFDHPTDICIGFDELVYVTDTNGLHILDRAGREYRTIPLKVLQLSSRIVC